jgi:multicomponent Na+:H+ antiporter subunit E
MRSLFLMNILLTLVWVALTGKFNYGNFIFGFVVSYGVIWILTRGSARVKYFQRFPRIL